VDFDKIALRQILNKGFLRKGIFECLELPS